TSTMPLNRRVGFLAARRKRCRQRNAVLTATPHRSAEAATVSLSLNEWPKSSQRSFLRNRASGVPVSALKLLRQSLQRKRRRPSAWPPPTDAPPQCGQRRASPKRSSIAAATAALGLPAGQHRLKLLALLCRQTVDLRQPRSKHLLIHRKPLSIHNKS